MSDKSAHEVRAAGGGYLKMEAMFGGLLTEVYCREHQEKRLCPLALVELAKKRVEGTELKGAVVAMEERVKEDGVPYASVEMFAEDFTPVIEMLGGQGRSKADRALAAELMLRLAALKRSLNAANKMPAQNGGKEGGGGKLER